MPRSVVAAFRLAGTRRACCHRVTSQVIPSLRADVALKQSLGGSTWFIMAWQVIWPLKGFKFARFLILERIAKIRKYLAFLSKIRMGVALGLGFLFPEKPRLSIPASTLSVLPVPCAGREHDPPVSCPPSTQTRSPDRRKHR